ncbi:MAG TPA: glycerol-3-phosphate dehydrogenase/oxidase [Aquabacterium sp.]|uniref:glycerol-3-phosphate dehydrogenase/oxidase n=1 Tax=Aquabacterium sp. TaxID=1872578 RepID=UPI002E362D90|nr:glycerol-3-phosphate dehydrogenase/oxidase [Aquabacterium sp.]HEX5356633.1 glycerol-3-phosphate dehydrogenase/oxidase [Aquabacterium sp.]
MADLLQRPSLAELSAVEPWDAVVIGGGITGAGIALEAARRKLKVLLLEQKDFSWGTSSRSSKMVHGGLRYIAQGDVKLTRHALQERERMLVELPDLVVRMPYIFPIRQGKFPGRWAMTAVLKLYDALAGIRDHRWMNRDAVLKAYPALKADGLQGAMRYTDALTDDSRLVIRVLQEAVLEGAVARNYTEVLTVQPHSSGSTLRLRDTDTGEAHEIRTRRVFNATGLWADRLSGTPPVVRPQRGTHLFVSAERLPVQDCLTIMHPDDGRPVFVFPWKGQTCIGTTDLDHRDDINTEPHCSSAEIDYLLKVANSEMPQLQLSRRDILSTMAGVRPIIASGKGRDPSKERRDHLVWQSGGVISVSGGKLTTFRQIALDALQAAGVIDAAAHRRAHQDRQRRCFTHLVSAPHGLNNPLGGMARGAALTEQVAWILRHEMVQHLDDLMLRRLRAGVLLADAGTSQLPLIKTLCESHLGWDEARWQVECQRYQHVINSSYRLG